MAKDAKRQKQDLLESDSDSEGSRNSGNSSNSSTANCKPTLQVNESYAKDFNQRKRKEELNKHKKSIQWDEAVRQYTIENEESDDDESVSSSEDEYAERLTPKVDLKILQTINAIRRGEEKVYNPQVKFFTEEDVDQSEEEEAQPTKPKKKRFKDVLREQILEQINSDDDEQASPEENNDVVKIHHLEYDEEQRNLRKDLIKSIHNSEDEEEDDDLLVNKPSKTTDMDEDAQEAIKNELDDLLQNSDKSLVDPKGEVKDGEAFLRDFILQRKWVDKDAEADDDSDGVDSQAKRKVKIIGGNDDDEDSLEELDRMEEFESKYNFRFEEQGDDKVQIVSYARGGTGDTFRRPEDTRKKKRQERKERKAAERKAKEEQLRRLKNARREELQEQLNQIKAVSGIVDDSSKTLDEETLAKLMEGDFDPDKFSSVMEQLYGDGFYQKEEEQWKSEADVKQCMQTAKELGKGLVDDFYDEGEDEEHEEEQQEQLVQDEEQYYDEQLEEEAPIPETQLERKFKKKMEEELYKLDYEDIVAGMPCRFKYKKVEPNSFGLTCEEILFAKDSTLKQFVSLKKMTPYREGQEFRVHAKKRAQFRKLLQGDYEELLQENGDNKSSLDKKQKKVQVEQFEVEEEPKKKRRRKRSKKRSSKGDDSDEDAVGEKNEKAELEVVNKDEIVFTPQKESESKKQSKKIANFKSQEKLSGHAETESSKPPQTEETQSKKKSKRRKKPKSIQGVSASRLASYNLKI